MFELAWPWIFALLPLPWLARLVLPAADSGEPVLKVGFLQELESLAGRRARLNLPTWRQQAPFVVIWLLLLCAAARPQTVTAASGDAVHLVVYVPMFESVLAFEALFKGARGFDDALGHAK